jgi:hypothetical protein
MDVTIGVITVLLLVALAVAIANAMGIGRAPLWLAVVLLCIVEAAQLGLLT